MERECLHITKNLLVEKDLKPSISGLLHRLKEDRKRSHILLGYFQSASRSFYLLLDQFATKNWSASGHHIIPKHIMYNSICIIWNRLDTHLGKDFYNYFSFFFFS